MLGKQGNALFAGLGTCLSALCLALAPGQICAAQTTVSPGDLAYDLGYFNWFIENAHAGPYRHVSEQSLKDELARLTRNLRQLEDKPVSIFDAWFTLQGFAALLADSHTRLNFPFAALPGSAGFWPYKVRTVAGRLIVTEKWRRDPVPAFAEIVDINGVTPQTMLAESQPLFGSTLPHTKSALFDRFFHVILSTRFNMNPPWTVRFKTASGTSQTRVQGVSRDTYFRHFTESRKYRESGFSAGGKRIPILEIPDFSYGDDAAYRRFIDQFFRKHRDAGVLVVDLRDNPGGNGFRGYYLLDHFADNSYQVAQSFLFKASKILRQSEYRGKVGPGLETAADGAYIPDRFGNMRNIERAGQRFRGKVFMLVSHGTRSAAVVTAAIFKFNNMGDIVGRETGELERFCSDPVTVKLPRSGLSASIPLAIYTLPGSHPDQPVVPHHRVDDYAGPVDRDLETVAQLIAADSAKRDDRKSAIRPD